MNEVVTAAWDSVVSDWENQSRHDALLALTVQNEAFEWVASRYKEQRSLRKGDAIADAQLVKLTNALMATMMATASKKSDEITPYKRTLVWLVVMVAMLLLGLVLVSFIAKTTPARDTTQQRR